MADRETPIQRAIVDYLRRVMPDALIHHSPNEHRRRQGKAAMIHAVNNKRNGVVTGFPDILVLPFSNVGAFFLEVKAEGNYASPAQREVHEHLRRLGYPVAVVRSIDDVRECLREWGIGFREACQEAAE